MDLEVSGENHSNAVHIVSPKEEVLEVPLGSDNNGKSEGDSALESRIDPSKDEDMDNSEGSLDISDNSEDDLSSSLSEISSYEDFLERLDGQLKKIEGEMITVLKFLALSMDNAGSSEKVKIQQTLEFFERIRGIRKRYFNVCSFVFLLTAVIFCFQVCIAS